MADARLRSFAKKPPLTLACRLSYWREYCQNSGHWILVGCIMLDQDSYPLTSDHPLCNAHVKCSGVSGCASTRGSFLGGIKPGEIREAACTTELWKRSWPVAAPASKILGRTRDWLR